MSMYAKLGRVDDSRAVFELFADRDIVSWNTIISSFSQNDQFREALDSFRVMIQEEIKPDGVTISSVVPACSHLTLLDVGKEIHCYVLKNDDLIGNSFVDSSLVDMYCNCQQVESGRRVFDSALKRSIGIWNAMLAGWLHTKWILYRGIDVIYRDDGILWVESEPDHCRKCFSGLCTL